MANDVDELRKAIDKFRNRKGRQPNQSEMNKLRESVYPPKDLAADLPYAEAARRRLGLNGWADSYKEPDPPIVIRPAGPDIRIPVVKEGMRITDIAENVKPETRFEYMSISRETLISALRELWDREIQPALTKDIQRQIQEAKRGLQNVVMTTLDKALTAAKTQTAMDDLRKQVVDQLGRSITINVGIRSPFVMGVVGAEVPVRRTYNFEDDKDNGDV